MTAIDLDIVRDIATEAIEDSVIDEIRTVDEGTDIVYELRVREDEDVSTYYFKTADQNHTTAFISEPVIQQRIAQVTDLPIPAVVDTGFLPTANSAPYILMEGLPGQHPSADWSNEDLYTVASEMGVALGELHDSLTFDSAGEIYGEPEDTTVHTDWEDTWADLIHWSAERMFGEVESPFDEYATAAKDYLETNRHTLPEDDTRTFTIMHGDYRFDNVLFDRTGKTPELSGVIDWGRIVAGDRRYNLVRTGYLIDRAFDTPENRQNARTHLYRGYTSVNSVTQDCETNERLPTNTFRDYFTAAPQDATFVPYLNVYTLHVMAVECKWFSQWYANKSDAWKTAREQYLLNLFGEILSTS